MVIALDEIMEDAFEGKVNFSFAAEGEVLIEIGKNYYTSSLPEKEWTEVDASIETSSKLIFIEAKLYGSVNPADDRSPFDQIIKKLRVGLDVSNVRGLEFYFIFLDIAPLDRLRDLSGASAMSKKSESVRLFELYRSDAAQLSTQLSPIFCPVDLPSRMGWYTWSSLFKTVLRAVVS
jgi:hypothetical protein